MKIFNKSEGWSSKVNFVDKHNVMLGYDSEQCCREYAGWFIADTIQSGLAPTCHRAVEGETIEMPGWRFDPEFFETSENGTAGECFAIFRIVRGKKEKFLHLFNCHNGYYSHGFTLEVNGAKVREGAL